MVTAAPSINSSPVWFFYQWSHSAGLWATIVLYDYCSNREDWKIKYLTSLIFTKEVRNEYGLVSQQCLQSSTQYAHTHTLFTWVLNTTYSSSLPGRQPHSVIQSLHDAGSLVDFLSALWRSNTTTLIWPFVSLKEKMSLNNSPHIYTRMKKNKVISIKIPLRKGDNKKYTVDHNQQSIWYLIGQKSQIPLQAINPLVSQSDCTYFKPQEDLLCHCPLQPYLR